MFLEILFRVLMFVMVALTAYFSVGIVLNYLYEDDPLPTTPSNQFINILEVNPNNNYFKNLFTNYETVYHEPKTSAASTVAIVQVDFSNYEMTESERIEASQYYLKSELKEKKPSMVIINYSNKRADFYGQTIYKLKHDRKTNQSVKINDYSYEYIESELIDLKDTYPGYDEKKSAYKMSYIRRTNETTQLSNTQHLSELNYNIFSTLERPLYYRQLDSLSMMQESNKEQGILMAGVALLIWNQYNREVSHQFVPITEEAVFTIYKEKDDYVFGLKSDNPIYYKQFFYKAEVPTYNMDYNLQLGAYFIEFGRVKEGSESISTFSPFFNLTHRLNHHSIEIVNDADDLLINGNKVWRTGERLTIKRIEYLFDVEYSYVYK
ncbi:hypothetical protein [Haloplasma contractile]|uniref:Uncharacterized protein n=1 Tax=Haloplasma contractile SSD-17B TaxID=1033810 RepID=U2FJ24_9MOLU|nr:hypothetical protein [Haloplasma contractile]ERJ11279.1 hypothetical protein HLPCO_002719 [Haloplasma contractile SSD-17B]